MAAKIARETGADKQAGTLSPWSHVVWLLYAQLTHGLGLNDVCDARRLHSGPLSSLRGATPPSRNNLSHADKVRADKGQPRTLAPEQQQWILQQAQAHLAVPVKVLYRRWRQQDPQLPSLTSIYRLLREHELHSQARCQQLRQPLGGATKCFGAPFVKDLWMTDSSPGPYLHPADGAKAVPTFLCVIIADHSRLIPYAAYYLRDDTQAFLQTLKEAVRRRPPARRRELRRGQRAGLPRFRDSELAMPYCYTTVALFAGERYKNLHRLSVSP